MAESEARAYPRAFDFFQRLGICFRRFHVVFDVADAFYLGFFVGRGGMVSGESISSSFKLILVISIICVDGLEFCVQHPPTTKFDMFVDAYFICDILVQFLTGIVERG